MSRCHKDELQPIEIADLAAVKGGVGDSMSSMLPMMMMMMMQRRNAAAAPVATPAPAQPAVPKILVNGVEQTPTAGPNGISFSTDV